MLDIHHRSKLHEKLHKEGISAPRWLVVVSSAHRRSACADFTDILIGKLNANPDKLEAAIRASGFEKVIICPSFEGQGYAVSCNGQPFEEVAYSE